MFRVPSKLSTLAAGSCLSKRGLVDLAKLSSLVDIKPEVRDALTKAPQSVVALESTIITHGMPYPQNLETALEVEQIVRQKGAIPATIGVVNGRVKVGVTSDELKVLARVDKESTLKTSRRDLAYVVSRKLNGGTTVAGTLVVASMVGIRIFATGGVGGVHRGGEHSLDISADLIELGRSPVAVVSSGVKSILDIPRTLEYLETQGVCVASYQCPDMEFPAFYFPTSGCKANCNLNNPVEAAELLSANNSLGLQSGFLIGVPLPEEHAIDRKLIEDATEQALSDAGQNAVGGKEMTPFVLAAISLHTKGRSLESNIALVKNNASVAAEIAVELARLENGGGAAKSGSQRAPVVIGGSIVDTCITVKDDEWKSSSQRVHKNGLTCWPAGLGSNDGWLHVASTHLLFFGEVRESSYSREAAQQILRVYWRPGIEGGGRLLAPLATTERGTARTMGSRQTPTLNGFSLLFNVHNLSPSTHHNFNKNLPLSTTDFASHSF